MFTYKWTKRPLGDLKMPKKSRRRLCSTICGPKFEMEIKRGPTSTVGATNIGQEAPKGRSLSRAGRGGGVLRRFKTRVDAFGRILMI
jgi:hypothetical protein